MAVRHLGELQRLSISPPDAEGQVRFHLEFRGATRRDAIEFDTSCDGAMGIMLGLQQMQVRHKIPVPANLRPQGRPTLTIVEPEGGREE
jgi:hypothetical protein